MSSPGSLPSSTSSLTRGQLGGILGLSAYGIWGLLPAFMKLLSDFPAMELVAHRVLWSLVLLAATAALMRHWRPVRAALGNARLLLMLGLSAVLIACNWLVYIWAVLNGHVLAASLGYYINPLINVALGVFLLHERLTRLQLFALGLAAIGVAPLTAEGGIATGISLALALSFGCYGLVRKLAPVDALTGFLIETAILAPLALAWLTWLGPTGGFGKDRADDALLVMSGVVTAVPLLLFAGAAKRLRLSTLGLFQYVAPTLAFFQALLLFGEPLRPVYLFAFACIWTGLALYAWDSLRGGAAIPPTPD